LNVLLAATLVSAACGGAKTRTQGQVIGDHVACRPLEIPGRFDCASVLQDFLHSNPNARIAGINVLYGGGQDELLVWRSDNPVWPTASTLVVDNHECSSTTGDEPDCATVIDDLTDANPAKHHYFIVPVYGTPAQPAHPGSWSVLDVHSAGNAVKSEAGWDSAHTELIRCRLGPGEPYLADFGEGVMHAQVVGSDNPVTGEYPGFCRPALINYLRAHADQPIAGVVALDGERTTHVGDKDEVSDPSTVALMIFVGSKRWPKASSLSVDDMACLEANCAANFAETRPKLKVSRRVLFTFPVGDTVRQQPGVDHLVLVSAIE
jgi:hypothetical protein